MKTTSIPGLELITCCLGAKLAETVRTKLQIKNITKFFWLNLAKTADVIKEIMAPFIFNRVYTNQYTDKI